MCTALPVYRGEIQCRMLGMAVEAFSVTGSPVERGERGELVCLKPFPCQPVGFWPLPGFGDKLAVEAANKRYHESYFSHFKGVWCKLSRKPSFPIEYANGLCFPQTMETTWLSHHQGQVTEEASSCLVEAMVFCAFPPLTMACRRAQAFPQESWRR
jgi:hypothetical protein